MGEEAVAGAPALVAVLVGGDRVTVQDEHGRAVSVAPDALGTALRATEAGRCVRLCVAGPPARLGSGGLGGRAIATDDDRPVGGEVRAAPAGAPAVSLAVPEALVRSAVEACRTAGHRLERVEAAVAAAARALPAPRAPQQAQLVALRLPGTGMVEVAIRRDDRLVHLAQVVTESLTTAVELVALAASVDGTVARIDDAVLVGADEREAAQVARSLGAPTGAVPEAEAGAVVAAGARADGGPALWIVPDLVRPQPAGPVAGRRERRARRRDAVRAGAAVAACAAVPLAGGLLLAAGPRSDAAAARQATAVLAPSVAAALPSARAAADTEAREELAAAVRTASIDWAAVEARLREAAPPGSTLTAWTFDGTTLDLAVSGGGDGAAAWAAALAGRPGFTVQATSEAGRVLVAVAP